MALLIGEIFRRNAEVVPGAAAASLDDRVLTHAELDETGLSCSMDKSEWVRTCFDFTALDGDKLRLLSSQYTFNSATQKWDSLRADCDVTYERAQS